MEFLRKGGNDGETKEIKTGWLVFSKHYRKHYGKNIEKRKIRIKTEPQNSIQGRRCFIHPAFEVHPPGHRDFRQEPGGVGEDPEEIS